MFFYIFCFYFWGHHCWWTDTNIIGNDVLFFVSFHCHQLFYCPHYRCSGVSGCDVFAQSCFFQTCLVADWLNWRSVFENKCVSMALQRYVVCESPFEQESTIHFWKPGLCWSKMVQRTWTSTMQLLILNFGKENNRTLFVFATNRRKSQKHRLWKTNIQSENWWINT